MKTRNCRMEDSNRESRSAYGSYHSKLGKDPIRKEEAHTHLVPALCQTLASHTSYLHLQLLTDYHLTFTKQKLKSKETERINVHCPARKHWADQSSDPGLCFLLNSVFCFNIFMEVGI